MPTPVTPRGKVERVIQQYISADGPTRAWQTVAHECGLKEGKQLKKYVEYFAPLYKIEVPERVYERLTNHERRQAELEHKANDAEPEFLVADLPEDDLPVEEIVAQRKREFAHKQKYEEAVKLRHVKVNLDGPIGILHFGDPHVDDDGTNLGLLEHHSNLTRTVKGLFGANVGDTTNNWVGRLAALYALQNCGRKRAVKIAEWFIKRTKFLYMIAGNHDMWSGEDDPIKWISKGSGTLYQPSEVRMVLHLPGGRDVRINARHDFKGHSQFNPAHGPMKALMFGVRDHIAVAGHRHESAYGLLKDPDTGMVCHAIKVASYKQYDRYAKDSGFRDQALGPACVTTFNTDLPETHPDMVKVFWDPDEGADYLKFLRKRAGA